MKKKILSLFTTLAMLCSFVGVMPITPTIEVEAFSENKTANFNKSYSLGSDPCQNMVNIAKAQKDRTKAEMGYTAAWCASFVSDCADLAGQSNAIPRDALCSTLRNNILNAGGYGVSTAQAGDIIFYYCSSCKSYKHVGLMINSTESVQGNYGGKVTLVSKPGSYSDGSHSCSSGVVKYSFIRPNYSDSPTPILPGTIDNNYTQPVTVTADHKFSTYDSYGNVESGRYIASGDSCYISEIYTNGFVKVQYPTSSGKRWAYAKKDDFKLNPIPTPTEKPVDLGTDFYAYIINTKAWKSIHNDSDNVSFRSKPIDGNDSREVWKFYRNSDGSYKIINCYDNKALDVDGGKSENQTNIQVWESNDSNAQRWYIYGQSAEYYFKPACSDRVLDMSGGIFSEGVNAQLWDKNYGDAQKMQVWKLDKPNLPGPTVKVENYGDDKGNNIKITWNACENATGYDIRVYDDKGENALYTYWNVQGTSYTAKVPAGNYKVRVWSLNSKFNFWTPGNMASFTAINNLGADFYAYIINTKAWKHLTNDSDNVSFRTENGDSRQVWRFKIQSDGSYKIINCKDNKLLDVQKAGSSNGTNITICEDNGSNAQRWYIYGSSGEFYLQPGCSNGVIDLQDRVFFEGVNAQIWERNYSDAQKLSIWELKKPNLPAASPKVEEYSDDKGNNVKITWNACDNATGYDIRIMDSTGSKVLYGYWNVKGTSYITRLPIGDYRIGICSLNSKFNFWTEGKVISFSVKKCSHTYGSWTTTKAATCTTDGSKTRKCSICGNVETAVITKTGHKYESKVIAPTCTEKGYTLFTCSVCKNSYKDKYTNAKGHSFGAWETKAATCTADGSKTRKCSACGKTETETIAKTGHKYEYKVIAPTCTEKGYTLFTCSVCKNSYKDKYTNAKGHSFGAWETKAATCTADGSKTRKCSACGKTETETIAKTGHKYESKVIAPTCAEKGYTLFTCSVCKNSYKDKYTNATGHKFGDWTTTKEPTCTADGTKSRKCSVCGKTETAAIPKYVCLTFGNEFSAAILHKGSGKPIFVNDDDIVVLNTMTPEKIKRETWRFVKNSDNSYKIVSYHNNKVLDIVDGKDENQNRICVRTDSGAASQKWYIIKTDNGVMLSPSNTKTKVLDLDSGNTDDNTNMQIYDLWTNNNQIFSLFTFEVPGKSTLKAAAGTSYTNTKFTWSKSTNADSYTVKVYKDKVSDGTPFKTYDTTSTEWNVTLPKGTYQVYVESCNKYCCTASDVITVKVEEGVCTHSFGDWETKQADCTKEGSKSRKCSICGKIETETIPKTNHKYKTDDVISTRLIKGHTHHKCSECGHSYDDNYKDYNKSLILVSDVVLIQKYLANSEKLNEEQIKSADINADGVVNVFDTIIFKRKILNGKN